MVTLKVKGRDIFLATEYLLMTDYSSKTFELYYSRFSPKAGVRILVIFRLLSK